MHTGPKLLGAPRDHAKRPVPRTGGPGVPSAERQRFSHNSFLFAQLHQVLRGVQATPAPPLTQWPDLPLGCPTPFGSFSSALCRAMSSGHTFQTLIPFTPKRCFRPSQVLSDGPVWKALSGSALPGQLRSSVCLERHHLVETGMTAACCWGSKRKMTEVAFLVSVF